MCYQATIMAQRQYLRQYDKYNIDTDQYLKRNKSKFNEYKKCQEFIISNFQNKRMLKIQCASLSYLRGKSVLLRLTT